MEENFEHPQVYRPIMAGVFAGIVATLLNVFYDVIYKSLTSFPLSDLINVTSLIFATLFVLAVAGVVFAVLDKYLPRASSLIHVLLFGLLTAYCVLLTFRTQRSPDPLLTAQFRQLLLGVVLITGILGTFLIPYLAKKENGII